MKNLNFLSLVALCMMISGEAWAASEIEGAAALKSFYTYRLENNQATITKVYSEAFGNVVVPAELDGYPVVSIGRSAFKELTAITAISFEEGSVIRNIDPFAFRGCTGLETVTLPDGLTAISDGLFYGCGSLRNVKIPDSVTEIGAAAFAECRSLENITLPIGITEMGESAFLNCRKLNEITLPETAVKIPGQCFYECRALPAIEIPKTTGEIGYSAFYNCLEMSQIHFFGDAPVLDTGNVFSGVPGIVYYEEGTAGWGSTFGGLKTAVWGSEPLNLDYAWDGSTLTLIFTGNLETSTDGSEWVAIDAVSPYIVEMTGKKKFYRSVK